MKPQPLPRFLAWWTDGVSLVLHAPTKADAIDLAVRLTAPPGVHLERVTTIQENLTP